MADKKVTALVEETSPTLTDLVYVVTDPGGTPTSKKVQIGNLPGSGGVPFKNLLINGDFRINQKTYVSADTLAAGDYAHDCWKGGASGGDYSFTQLVAPTQITIAANKTLIQVVAPEDVEGGNYVLSWEGTCQARYAINSDTPTGSYASSPIAITGQTAGTVMSVEFGNGASSGTLGKAQLEPGTVKTAFEFLLKEISLDRCLTQYRVYGRGFLSAPSVIMPLVGTRQAASTVAVNLPISKAMRITPSALGTGTFFIRDGDGTDSAAAFGGINGASLDGLSVYLTTTLSPSLTKTIHIFANTSSGIEFFAHP